MFFLHLLTLRVFQLLDDHYDDLYVSKGRGVRLAEKSMSESSCSDEREKEVAIPSVSSYESSSDHAAQQHQCNEDAASATKRNNKLLM